MKPDNTQETIYVGLDTGLPPYLPYPRFLLKMDISQTAKLLYALLLDRTTLSQRNGWQDDQGRTFIVYPIAEIAEMLDKGQTAIKAALNELDAAGLLERKRAGFSAANRLYVKLPPLVRISDPMTVGKATLISAENRPTDGRKSDLNKELLSLIMSLPRKQAERIYSCFFLGLSATQIAIAENTNPRRVAESIQKGIKKLRERISVNFL